jgi:hypothetical protein
VNWISWEGGVYLSGGAPESDEMNVIVHVTRLMQTPVGSAPAGLVMLPDIDNPTGPPAVIGFISTDTSVAGYLGSHIFRGTRFEHAPVFRVDMEIITRPEWVSAKIVLGGALIEARFEELSDPYIIHREPGIFPFYQQGIEREAGRASLTINGIKLELDLEDVVTLCGGPGAVVAPAGIYCRL